MYGGTVRVVCDLSRILAQRGHEVTVYTTDMGVERRLSENDKIDLGAAADVHYFRSSNNGLAYGGQLHFSRQMRLAIKHDLRQFDIVHLHELRTIPNAYVWYYSRKYGVPYVIQPHGQIVYHDYESMFKRTSKQAFDRAISIKLTEDAAKLLALTNTEKDQLTDFGIKQEKIEIIPNGINTADYDPLPIKGQFRENYEIAINEKVVLYLGRLHKRKRIDKLIDAFVEVKEAFENTKLVIAGPDEGSLSALEKQAHDCGLTDDTIFTGLLDNSAKPCAYVDADVSVLPAMNEAFGITILESILCGTPVITSAEGGCGELLRSMGCDRLAQFDDIKMLSKNIKYILRHQIEGENLVKMGRRYILENLTWSRIAGKVETLYESCM
jgi:glycosyltransferase involved in cell wall biosynthesis